MRSHELRDIKVGLGQLQVDISGMGSGVMMQLALLR